MYIERAQSNLLNLYVQLALLLKETETAEEAQLLQTLQELHGSLTLAELCKATGLTEDYILRCYFEGEKMSLSRSIDITHLIIMTHRFTTVFLKFIRRYATQPITEKEIDFYLNDFLNKDGMRLRTMDVTGKQNICGWLINGIGRIQMNIEEGHEAELVARIVSSAKRANLTITTDIPVAPREVSEPYFNPSKFFDLVTKFDELQGTMMISGNNTVIRSLLDVIAYLDSPTIKRERAYVTNEGVFFNAEEDDRYEASANFGYSSLQKSTEYREMVPNVYIANTRNILYKKESVFLSADFGGAEIPNDQDKIKKKRTYHRLIDMILEKKYRNLFDFVVNTVRYSELLTREDGRTTSNSPLFKSTSGYVNVPTDSKELDSLKEILGDESVFSIVQSGSPVEKILNDVSIAKMLEISNIVVVIADMRNQLEASFLNWFYLRPLFAEYKDLAIKVDINFKNITDCYKCYRTLKDEPNTYYYPIAEWTSKVPAQMGSKVTQKDKDSLIEISGLNFNTPEEIQSVQDMIDYFENPTLDTLQRVLKEEILVELDPVQLSDEMDFVYREYAQRGLQQIIGSIRKNFEVLLNIYSAYCKYNQQVIELSLGAKQTYRLMYAMRYDYYVKLLRIDMEKVLKYPEIYASSPELTKKVAANLIRRFIQKYRLTLHYCLKESLLIDKETGDYSIESEEVQVQKIFDSDRCKSLKTLLLSIKDGTLIKPSIDTRYVIDEYTIYRTKSTNEFVLEFYGFDERQRELRRIKNLYDLNIIAVKEGMGSWKIEIC